MNSKIVIATHKQYEFPNHALYTPIHVGKVLSSSDFGYLGDESGENISHKNKNFCEITALYWAWKNDYFKDYKYCGLTHYRRYFSGNHTFKTVSILSEIQIDEEMLHYDILLPKKRKYYIESIENHYVNAHNKSDLTMVKEILTQRHPQYLDAFDTLIKQKSLYLFNMFIMTTERFNTYMQWLFDILFELEKRIDVSKYDPYQSRIFGFMSERLFNVWIIKNELKIKELHIINLEGENTLLKAYGLLKRKYLK